MIMICERCYSPVGEDEPVVRLAHIDRAHADGSVTWVHSYVHTTACAEPATPAHQRPDTGSWDSSRGVGGHRP